MLVFYHFKNSRIKISFTWEKNSMGWHIPLTQIITIFTILENRDLILQVEYLL
jgi:hypothetical protein